MYAKYGKCLSSKTRAMYLRSDDNWRQSFDRFGDDLCQYLLSFLSFEDTFRCECVSKQWQRLVFNTITELNYSIN